MQKGPKTKHPGNRGHNEKTKHKDNRYRRRNIFHDINKLTTVFYHKPNPSMDNKWKTTTQGGKLYPRQSKKIIYFSQAQRR